MHEETSAEKIKGRGGTGVYLEQGNSYPMRLASQAWKDWIARKLTFKKKSYEAFTCTRKENSRNINIGVRK